MIVYVESNFLLETVLEQEESAYALEMLKRAEEAEIDLRFPSIGLYEPLSHIAYQGAKRAALGDELDRQSRQLDRSIAHKDIASHLSTARIRLIKLGKIETDNYERIARILLQSCTQISMDHQVFAEAVRLQYDLPLELADAIVLSTILSDMRGLPHDAVKCFASRDAKAFGRAQIRDLLKGFNCRYLSSFAATIAYLDSIDLSS